MLSLRCNKTFERTLKQRGRIVLARDCLLADAQRRRCRSTRSLGFTRNTVASFEALNSLETALLEAQHGKLVADDFLNKLLESQVFVLIDKDIGSSGVWDNSAEPPKRRGRRA